MWHKNHFIRIEVVEYAIIIMADRVAVPVPKQRIQHDQPDETIDIEHRRQRIKDLLLCSLLSRCHKKREIRQILRIFTGVHVQFGINVPGKSAIVEISVGILEETMDKLLVPALCQNVKTKIAAIEINTRMTGARHRHASFQVELAA